MSTSPSCEVICFLKNWRDEVGCDAHENVTFWALYKVNLNEKGDFPVNVSQSCVKTIDVLLNGLSI